MSEKYKNYSCKVLAISGLHEGLQNLGLAFRKISIFSKHFIIFFLNLWIVFAFLDGDPDSDSQTPMNPCIIRIRFRSRALFMTMSEGNRLKKFIISTGNCLLSSESSVYSLYFASFPESSRNQTLPMILCSIGWNLCFTRFLLTKWRWDHCRIVRNTRHLSAATQPIFFISEAVFDRPERI